MINIFVHIGVFLLEAVDVDVFTHFVFIWLIWWRIITINRRFLFVVTH